MTTHHSRGIRSVQAAARVAVGSVSHPVAETVGQRLDATVALRRCAMYRRAFPGAAVSYPAGLLRMDAVAVWVKQHGVSVDVTSVDELTLAVAEGVPPSRLVVHPTDATDGPIRRAVDAGAGRFVVHSGRQLGVLAACARRPQRVLVDVTTRSADVLATRAVSCQRLDLIGLESNRRRRS